MKEEAKEDDDDDEIKIRNESLKEEHNQKFDKKTRIVGRIKFCDSESKI